LTIVGVQGYGAGDPLATTAVDWGITYPIATDGEHATWGAYGIRAKPAYALVGRDGGLLHRQVGLVTTDDTRKRISEALAQ
jgi:hypothetical protein